MFRACLIKKNILKAKNYKKKYNFKKSIGLKKYYTFKKLYCHSTDNIIMNNEANNENWKSDYTCLLKNTLFLMNGRQ